MRTYSFCGTIEYMSPELIKGGLEGHDFSVDWWSVGVLTYELLTGASPFTVDGERNTQAEISKRILKNQPPIPDHLSSQAKDFIRKLLIKDPIKRLGGGPKDAEELKGHPFLRSINWTLLTERKVPPPFLPQIDHELDVSNFAEEFTSMAPEMFVKSRRKVVGDNNDNEEDNNNEEDDDYYTSSDDSYDSGDDNKSMILANEEFELLKCDASKLDETELKASLHSSSPLTIDSRQYNGYSGFVSPNTFSRNKSIDCANSGIYIPSNEISFNLNHQQSYLFKVEDHLDLSTQDPSKLHLLNSLVANGFIKSPFKQNSNHTKRQQQKSLKRNNIGQNNLHLVGRLADQYSKLFRGYSYTNPIAIEWLDSGNSKERCSVIRPNNSLSDLGECESSSSSSTLNEQLHDFLITKSYWRPHTSIASSTTSGVTPNANSNSSCGRVAFTIGDGEDLASAIAAACEPKASQKLVVGKRSPSLELFYEKYAKQQSTVDAKVVAAKCLVPLKSVTNDNDGANANISKRQATTNNYVNLQCDPQSDFFKAYKLNYPLTSKRDLLGQGAYSICKRCIHLDTGKEFAVKVVRRKFDSSREISALRACQDHPNVVRLFDVFYDQFNTYIVLELLRGGELLSRIRRREDFEERDVCRVFRSLVSVVDHLHCNGFVHRDLKPENIMFVDKTAQSEIRLIDFGFAREIPEPKNDSYMASPCVTLDYCAPEVLRHAIGARGKNKSKTAVSQDVEEMSPPEGYDHRCDLWSLGATLYAMLCGSLPFRSSTQSSNAVNLDSLSIGKLDFTSQIWKNVSEAAKDIVRGLMTVDADKRLTIQDLVHSNWIMNFDGEQQELELKRKRKKSSSSKCQKSSKQQNQSTFSMSLRRRRLRSTVTPTTASTATSSITPPPKTQLSNERRRQLKRSLDNAAVVQSPQCSKRSKLSVVIKFNRNKASTR